MTEPIKHTAVQEEHCAQAPELADFLGHDKIGHLVLNAMIRNDVKTIAGLRQQSDRDIKSLENIGPAALARVRELVPEPRILRTLGESATEPISDDRVREIIKELNEYQQGDGYDVFGDVAIPLPEFNAAETQLLSGDETDEFALFDNTYVKEDDEGWWYAYRMYDDEKYWLMDTHGIVYIRRGKGWKAVGERPEIPEWHWNMED